MTMNEGGQIGPMSRDSTYYLHKFNQLYVYQYSYVFPTVSPIPTFLIITSLPSKLKTETFKWKVGSTLSLHHCSPLLPSPSLLSPGTKTSPLICERNWPCSLIEPLPRKPKPCDSLFLTETIPKPQSQGEVPYLRNKASQREWLSEQSPWPWGLILPAGNIFLPTKRCRHIPGQALSENSVLF